ncbi:Protein kibra [Eumeta japonica]|uniref:Protein kibra n=1 Tax=Eumeta variegata TaxID=151549 RepID=A0A4C1TV32_EUMVA|nr:Protein kibra [Eumeta japonica]
MPTIKDDVNKYSAKYKVRLQNHTDQFARGLVVTKYDITRYTKPQSFADCIGNELPLGWEEAYDPQVGPYYINHINQPATIILLAFKDQGKSRGKTLRFYGGYLDLQRYEALGACGVSVETNCFGLALPNWEQLEERPRKPAGDPPRLPA